MSEKQTDLTFGCLALHGVSYQVWLLGASGEKLWILGLSEDSAEEAWADAEEAVKELHETLLKTRAIHAAESI